MRKLPAGSGAKALGTASVAASPIAGRSPLAEPGGLRSEGERQDQVWAGVLLRRLRRVVDGPADGGHKGEPVGRRGRDRVRPGRRRQPVVRWRADGAVSGKAINRRPAALIIG